MPYQENKYLAFRESVLDIPGMAERRFPTYLEAAETIEADGLVATHSRRQLEVVRDMCYAETAAGRIWSGTERSDLLITAIWHDLTELLDDNHDTPFMHKSAEGEAKERASFRHFLTTTCPPGLRPRLERVYFYSHDLVGKETAVGRFFALSERVGYTRTAIERFEKQDIQRWEQLALEVASKHTPVLLAAGGDYPSAHSFLLKHRSTLMHIYDRLCLPTTYEKYQQGLTDRLGVQSSDDLEAHAQHIQGRLMALRSWEDRIAEPNLLPLPTLD